MSPKIQWENRISRLGTMLHGDRLKQLRVQKGFTHQQLAEQLGLGTKQIWRYESGENDPTGDILRRIAQAFNVSVDYLLGLVNEPTPWLCEGDLTSKEREVLVAWRRGDRMEAIRAIVLEEAS
jgi:transcriptional regulator with XRE-family HTH domain